MTGDRESAMGELVGTQVYSEAEGKMRQVLAQAGYLAAQYNYEKAIHLLERQEEFAASENLQEAAAYYQKMLESCVEYPLEEITHVFFHILIKDNAKAFDGDSDEAGYNQYMTTISEFNGIIHDM